MNPCKSLTRLNRCRHKYHMSKVITCFNTWIWAWDEILNHQNWYFPERFDKCSHEVLLEAFLSQHGYEEAFTPHSQNFTVDFFMTFFWGEGTPAQAHAAWWYEELQKVCRTWNAWNGTRSGVANMVSMLSTTVSVICIGLVKCVRHLALGIWTAWQNWKAEQVFICLCRTWDWFCQSWQTEGSMQSLFPFSQVLFDTISSG